MSYNNLFDENTELKNKTRLQAKIIVVLVVMLGFLFFLFSGSNVEIASYKCNPEKIMNRSFVSCNICFTTFLKNITCKSFIYEVGS